MKDEQQVFADFCTARKLKNSTRRNKVIEKFLAVEKHISALELYNELRKDGIAIGYSTVYRTLKLLAESGLAREVNFGNRETHFEHKFQHPHHDHLVCLVCGQTIEFKSPRLEKLQLQIARKNRFKPQAHNLVIYGQCAKCYRL